jgi:hypothetical protein
VKHSPRPRQRLPWAAALLAATVACETTTDDLVHPDIARGIVEGILFLDVNLSNSFNPGIDVLLRAQPVSLRARGAHVDYHTTVTDTGGFFRFPDAAVGRYRVLAPASLLGDSLEVLPGSDTEFTLAASDTVPVVFGLVVRSFNIAEARAMPLGARRWVRGQPLNTQGTFGDSTVHLADTTGAIRAINVRPQFAIFSIGDSVRFLGTRTQRDGQPAIDISAVVVRNFGNPPPPVTLTTQEATTAAGGTRDAQLAIVRNVTISDTATVNFVRILGVNDGSGRLTVYLSPFVSFDPLTAWVPGVRVDITGLLVPFPGGGGYQLKPRARSDLVIRS